MSMFTKTDAIIEAQKAEALLRMKKLDIHENAINEFKKAGKLNKSEPGWNNVVGVLYWLDDDEQKMVRAWEEKTGNMVYHVIRNNTKMGLMYSFLYVSRNVDEWVMDNEDLELGYPLAYVKNMDDDWCSEYGAIGIRKGFGGVVRVA